MVAFLSSSSPDLTEGVGRQPRVAVAINGTLVGEIITVLVHQNNYLAADTFRVVVAWNLDAGVPSWTQLDVIELDVKIAQAGGTAQSVITGLADEVTTDLASGTVTITGRDFTAQFIEAKTAEKFQNLTSSQVVALLAARHGLASQVSATTTPTGNFYDSDHAVVTNEVSEGTLLSFLAGREGFDIFFSGETLYFQPAADLTKDVPFEVFCTIGGSYPVGNVSRLVTRRSLTLARDVIVKVISWSHEAKAAISATRRAEKTTSSAHGSGSPATTYVIREAGLTQDQANSLADTKLRDLTLHERRIDFELPGDLSITPRSLVRLSGTNTDFDQTYFVSQIQLLFSLEKGFLMKVTAKNASPHSVVSA